MSQGTEMDGELPEGWRWGTLGDLAHIRNGFAFKSSDFQDQGVPVIRQGNLTGLTVDLSDARCVERRFLSECSKFVVTRGDILIGMSGSLGNASVYQEDTPALQNQRIGKLEPTVDDPGAHGYVLWYLRSIQGELRGKGLGVQNISAKELEAMPVGVPPLPEQRRIVKKLESLQARSRRAREALDAVPALLEKLRQSILAAAFRGDLTADWRAQHPDVEPASELLKRIRIERRKKWEEAELAKLKAKGKVPPDDKWKQKYVEPEPVDDSELPELPEGWCWASVEELCPFDAPAVYGIILPGEDIADGIPYIRPIDITPQGTIDFTSIKRTSPEIAAQYSRASLRVGDIVLSIVGTIGKVIVTPQELHGGNITQSSIRIRPPDFLTSEYIRLALQSPQLTKQFDKYRFGNAVQRLNVEDVRRLAIPIAPKAELKAIERTTIASLARLTSGAVDSLVVSLKRLNSAILAKAFRGELVPQDPSEVVTETASGAAHRDVAAKAKSRKAARR